MAMMNVSNRRRSCLKLFLLGCLLNTSALLIPFPAAAITFTDSGGNYAFQSNEKNLLLSMLGMLPVTDLTGITTIQGAPYNADGVFDTLLPGGIVQLALPPISSRLTDAFYPLLAYHFTEAVGENVYRSLLTAQEQQEWAGLIPAGVSPQKQFGQAYSLWTLSSNDLISQALAGTSAVKVSLAQALFASSLFLASNTSVMGYSASNLQNNLFQPAESSLPLSYTASSASSDGSLTIGSYNFKIKNNAITSWSSGNSTSTVLTAPVALPATWLNRYAATVIPPSPVKVNAVVSAASYISSQSAPLAPASYATIFGSNLSGKTVSITMNGIPVSSDTNHYFGNDNQINFQIPAALGSATTAQLVVTVDGQKSAPFTVALAPVSPAIFMSGILNSDNSVNTASKPIAAGDYVSIYLTGMLPANVSYKNVNVTVFVGGRQATVLYAGPPGGVDAYDWYQQVNIVVPADMTPGTDLVVICATPPGGAQVCSPSSSSDPVHPYIYIGPAAQPGAVSHDASSSQKESVEPQIISTPSSLGRSSSGLVPVVTSGDNPFSYIPLNSAAGQKRLNNLLLNARQGPNGLPSLNDLTSPSDHPVIQQ